MSSLFRLLHISDWFTWFFGILLLDFNPHPESCKYASKYENVNKFFNKIGMKPGKWYRQREELQGTILKSIRTRGKSSYFLSDAAINFRRESLAGEADTTYTRKISSPVEMDSHSQWSRKLSHSSSPEAILRVKVPKNAKPGKTVISVTTASGAILKLVGFL